MRRRIPDEALRSIVRGAGNIDLSGVRRMARDLVETRVQRDAATRVAHLAERLISKLDLDEIGSADAYYAAAELRAEVAHDRGAAVGYPRGMPDPVTRTMPDVLAKLKATGVRPAYITAVGTVTDQQLWELEHYGYYLVNLASVGDGTFCTTPVPGSTAPYCLITLLHDAK